MKKSFLSFLLCLLMALLTPWSTTSAQETITLTGDISKALTPGATYTFYDSGGENSDYSTYESYTATFTNSGDITINFTSLVTESSSGCSNWDYMLIYDGDATTGTLLGRGQSGCSTALSTGTNYTAGSGTMTIVWKSDSGTNGAGWVATITAGMPPSCPKPKNLAAELTMGDGTVATLSWTPGESETYWVVEYTTDANFATYEEDFPNGSPTTNLVGLTPETTYYARVKARCGGNNDTDNSEYSNVVTFTPTDEYSLTLNEGTNTNTSMPINGSYCDYGNRSQFIIPATSLTGILWADINKLTFYSSSTLTATFAGTVFKVYMTEVANTVFESTTFVDWTSLNEVYNGALSWSGTEWVFEFDNNYMYKGGNLLVAFEETSYTSSYTSISWLGVSQSGNTALRQNASVWHSYSGSPTQVMFLPQMKITYTPGTAPACVPPADLDYANVSTTTADLSWTAGGTETAWQICVNNDEDHLINVSAPSYQLTGLTPNQTLYTVKVRSVCTENSDWCTPVSFRTECESITIDAEHTSWVENFNSLTTSGTIPACWDNSEGTTTSANYKWSYYATGREGACVRFDSYSNSNNNTNILATPTIHLGINAILTFYCKNPVGGAYEVKISQDGAAAVSLLGGLTGISSWTQKEIDLSAYTGHDVVIYFCGTSNYGSSGAYLDLDDVEIHEKPACPIPTGLQYAEVLNHSVQLSWTEKGEAPAWQIAYKAAGDADFIELPVTENPYTLTGLTPSTNYTVKVLANCGTDGMSEPSETVNFTTKVACEPLASISVTNIQRRSMDVNMGEAGSYELAYFTETKTEEELNALAEEEKVSVSAATYSLTGLERETTYHIYVRVNCGEEDGFSTWTHAEATTKGLNGCDEIQAGSGSGTSSVIPTHSNYDYSLSEQIYTAAEMQQAGSISSIAFYNAGSLKTRTLDIYMLHTSKTAFESASDWVSYAESDKVFSGSVSFTAGAWVTINLTDPFAYNGTDNLLLVVDDNTNSYSSGLSCKTYTTTEYEALYKYQDDNDIVPASTTGTLSKSKNQVQFSFCYTLDACPAITGLSYELPGKGMTEANISWTASSADYFSGYEAILSTSKITDFTGVEPTHTDIASNELNLTELTEGTHYYIYVRALCAAEQEADDQQSAWADINFTTKTECSKVQNLTAALTGLHAVHVAWDEAFEGQELHFQYVLSKEEELDAATLETKTPTPVNDAKSIDIGAELAFDVEYHIYVASVCGDDHSDYEHASFKTLEECQKVKNLKAVRTAHNLIELTWESAQFATETEWEVGIEGDASKTQTVSERHALIYGLTAGTDYTAYVKAKCDESTFSDAATVDFTAAAEPAPCKQVGNGTSTTSYGPIYSYLMNRAYTQQLYKASDIDRKAGRITSIAFEHKGNGSNGDMTATDYVIYMAETSATSLSSSWISEGLTKVFEGTTIFAHGTSGNWVSINLDTPFEWDGEKNIVVAVYTPNTPTLSAGSYDSYFFGTSVSGCAVYMSNPTIGTNLVPTSSGNTVVTRPNIQFCFEAKACPDVVKLAASGITIDEATVSWEPAGYETAWNVLLSTNSEETDFSGAETVTTLSKHFTGLTQGTDYYVYVQPDGCEGADFSVVHFQTVATCLKMTGVTVSGIEAHNATITWTDLNETPAGSYTIAYGYAEADEDEGIVAFDPEDNTTYIGSFDVTTTTANFDEQPQLAAETAYKFAVRANCSSSDQSRWSDVVPFTTGIACFVPTNLGSNSVTHNSATLTWADDANQSGVTYTVVYGIDGSFNINDNATYPADGYVSGITETHLDVDDLSPATKYTFYVKSDCSGYNEGESASWASLAAPFQTECAAYTDSYTENFDSYSGSTGASVPTGYPNDELPTCWQFLNRSTSSSTYPQVFISSNTGYAVSDNCLFFKSSNTTPLYAILPEFTNNISELMLTFTYRNEGVSDYNGTLYAGYMTDPTDASTFTSLLTCQQTTTLTEKDLKFDEAPAGSYIAFKYQGGSNNNYYMSIDNVQVGLKPTCEKPTGLAKSNVTAHTADLSWTAGAGETAWQICVNDNETDLIAVNTTPSYQLTGLTPEASYTVKVRANCGEGDSNKSGWSAPVNFNTGIACVKPTALAAQLTPGNGTIASLTWTAGGSEPQWVVEYSTKSDYSENKVTETVDNPSFNLTGLTEKTTYYVRVQAACGGLDGSSQWTTSSFTTPCNAISADGWTDGLEDGIGCWTVGNVQSSSSSYKPSATSSSVHEGSKALYMYAYKYTSSYDASYSINADSAYAVLPAMTFGEGGIKKYTLSFYAKSASSSASYNQHLYVGVAVSPTDMSTFTLVKDVTVTTDYAQYEVDFASYEGAGSCIVVLATVPAGSTAQYRYGQFYADDFATKRTPTCQPLASISVSEIERLSMKVNLHPKAGLALADAYELAYFTETKTEEELNALAEEEKVSVSAATYSLTGLERETKYYIYVRANCGGEDVSDWVSTEATTKGLNACDEQSVGTGTTSSSNSAPLAGYYHYGYAQQLYLASEIDHEAGAINKIAFAYNATTSTTRNLTIFMANTDVENLSSSYVSEGLTQVVAAKDITFDNSSAWCTIDLDEPFDYTGGNVVVAVYMTQTASETYYSSDSRFVQTNITGMTRYQNSDSADPALTENGVPSTGSPYSSDSRPNIQFSFCYTLDACPVVTDLSHELLNAGTTEARISWTASSADYLSGYEAILSTTEITDFTGVEPTHTDIASNELNLTGLTAGTQYYIYVRAICSDENHDDGSSTWVGLDFTTNADCPKVLNLAATLTDLNAVHIAWEKAFDEQAAKFQYVLSTVGPDAIDFENLPEGWPKAINGATSKDTAGLAFSTDYHVYVASVCDADHSEYEHVPFTTYAECQAVENLTVARKEHNLVELTWTSAEFATETEWEVGIVGDDSKTQTVSDRHALIYGLTAGTDYTAYVKAKCDESTFSDAATVDFTAAAEPAPCKQVGEGTSTGSMPVSMYDYAYTQMIYGKELIGRSGNITSMVLKRSEYANVMNNMKVYLGTSAKATFASTTDWVAESDLTLVYEGSFPAGTASAPDLELALSTPFNYNGTENLVVAISNGHGHWNSRQQFYNTSATGSVLCHREDGDASYANHPGTAAGQSLSAERTNIQFCFEAKDCPDVTKLEVSDITKTTATVSWEPMGSETAWKVLLSTNSEETDFSGAEAVTTLSKHFTGLEQGTDYYVYVQPVCTPDATYSMVHFQSIATCLAMTDPEVVEESITAHAARVTWTDPKQENAGNYYVAYAKEGESLDLTNSEAWVHATDTIVTLSGLDAEATYQFAVKADCGDIDGESRWSAVASFTTKCDAISSFPWNENFENMSANTIPQCWDNSGSTSTDYAANPHYCWGVYSYSSNTMLRMYNFYTHGPVALINTPGIALPSEGKYEFTFKYAHTASCGNFTLKLYDGENWTDVKSYGKTSTGTDSSNPGTFAADTINLTDYAGKTIILQFYSTPNYGNGAIFVDEVSVHVRPCQIPKELQAPSATSNSINLTWKMGEEESAWNARYRIGTGAWSAATLTNLAVDGTDCSATLTGLQPSTTYEIQVQANCGNAQSNWSASATQTTLCGAYDMPFMQNFNSLTSGIPACWNNEEGTTTNASYRWNYNTDGHEGKCVRFNSHGNAEGNTNYLQSPSIAITDTAAVLRFWYKNPEGGDFSVYYTEEGSTTEVALATGLTGAADWTEKSIRLAACAGKTVIILFKGTSNNATSTTNPKASIYLDDVRVARELILADTKDNTATLNAYMGKTVDVTLGRKFICSGYDEKEDHYNVICLPFSLSAEQLAASPIASEDVWAFKYAIKDEATNELLFRIIQVESIEAGKPYFIGLPAGDNIVSPKFENVTIAASAGQQIGDPDIAQLCGNMVPEPFAAHDPNKLFIYPQTNTLYWWNGNTASQLNSFRAYFNVNTSNLNGAPIFRGMSARLIKFDKQTPTGIEQTEAGSTSVEVQKIIENDHVVIIRNGVKYSIEGQVISK